MRQGPTALALAILAAGSPPAARPVQAQPYRVQVLATRNQHGIAADVRSLERLVDPLTLHIVPAGDWIKLQVGDFETSAETAPVLAQIRRAGYPDAWVTRTEPDTANYSLPPPSSPPAATRSFNSTAATPLDAPATPLYAPAITKPATPGRAPAAAIPTSLSSAHIVVTVAGRFESNIDHRDVPVSAWGLITGVGLVYQFEAGDTDIDLSYEVARHHYASSPRWNRIGHTARAMLEQDLGGPWTLRLEGEASLGGSTEDRELSDVYSLRPRLEFDLGHRSSLRLKTALRFKRPEGVPDQNATAPYAGLEFKQYLGSGVSWSVGSRYELKHTPSVRHRYRRWTSEADVAFPVLRRSRVELGLKVRFKDYTDRLIQLADGTESLRRDHRIKPSLSWIQPIGDLIEARLEYEYESRASNDPAKVYHAHAFGFSLRTQLP